jgi:hypothetical protein
MLDGGITKFHCTLTFKFTKKTVKKYFRCKMAKLTSELTFRSECHLSEIQFGFLWDKKQ